jgi:hypothetical protein
MTTRKDPTKPFGDIELPHETVADSFGDGLGSEPLTVWLGGLWTDFVRAADVPRDPDSSQRSSSAVPLLDDMKGILQWD